MKVLTSINIVDNITHHTDIFFWQTKCLFTYSLQILYRYVYNLDLRSQNCYIFKTLFKTTYSTLTFKNCLFNSSNLSAIFSY